MRISDWSSDVCSSDLTVVECLKKGGVIIYPTDTVYGMGCDITNQKAIERVCRSKGVKPERAQLSFICKDLSHLADYCRPLNNSTFRILEQALPGPFTFILNATNQVPTLWNIKKKTGDRWATRSVGK